MLFSETFNRTLKIFSHTTLVKGRKLSSDILKMRGISTFTFYAQIGTLDTIFTIIKFTYDVFCFVLNFKTRLDPSAFELRHLHSMVQLHFLHLDYCIWFQIFYRCRRCRYYYVYEGKDFGYLNYSVGRESLDKLHYTMVWKPNKPRDVNTTGAQT